MRILDLGTIGYEDAMAAQDKVLEERKKDLVPDTLILLEHFPVVTLGRLSGEEQIIDRSFFEERDIPVISARRGGEITYHAPGQLVMYPVIDLRRKEKDVRKYIDFLQATVCRSLGRIGVSSEINPDRRGVWSGSRKIAFIGVAVSRWITSHGVAININNDIAAFSRIHPCGEKDIKVVSARELVDTEIGMDAVKEVFAGNFAYDMDVFYKGVAAERKGSTVSSAPVMTNCNGAEERGAGESRWS